MKIWHTLIRFTAKFTQIMPRRRTGCQCQINRRPGIIQPSRYCHCHIVDSGDMSQRLERGSLTVQAHHLIYVLAAELLFKMGVFPGPVKCLILLLCKQFKIIVRAERNHFSLLIEKELQKSQKHQSPGGKRGSGPGKFRVRVQDMRRIFVGKGHPAFLRIPIPAKPRKLRMAKFQNLCTRKSPRYREPRFKRLLPLISHKYGLHRPAAQA